MNGNLLNNIFKGRNSQIEVQFFRYFCSGGLAFMVDKSLFVATHYSALHLNEYWSTSIGFVAGLIITYTLSVKWVFDERKMKNKTHEFLIFAIIGVIGLGLMNLFMWCFDSIESISMENKFYCNLLSTGLVTLWNFFAKKIILFTK